MGIVYSCMYFFSLSAKSTKEFSYKIKSWNIVLYVVLKTKKCPQQPPSEPFLLYFWLLMFCFFVWFFSCCFPSWWALLFLPSHFTFQPIDIQPMRRPLFPTTCNTAVPYVAHNEKDISLLLLPDECLSTWLNKSLSLSNRSLVLITI